MKGEVRTFGVSGWLYLNAVLLWDSYGESFWSQIHGRALAGPEAGEALRSIQVEDTSWKDFKKRFPKAEVLKGPLGKSYKKNPYASYKKSGRAGIRPMPDDRVSERKDLKNQDVVTGFSLGDEALCVPHKEIELLRKNEKVSLPLRVTVGGYEVDVHWDHDAEVVRVQWPKELAAIEDSSKKTATNKSSKPEVITLRAYWFGWYAFNPKTRVMTAKEWLKVSEQEGAAKREEEDKSSDAK